jgi:MSHA pilin protein MshA
MKFRRDTRKRPARHQRGMTLLDTVVTITMIGSVSAVALPKLNELPREARIAVVEHLAGAVRSASALAHMKCVVQSECAMQTGTAMVEMGGDAVRLTHGYPAAGEPDGVALALEFSGFGTQHSPGQTLLTKDGAPDPQRCAVAYAEPQAPGRGPQLDVITSGC